MDEQRQNTTSNDLIYLLLHDGLGESLPRIAEIPMNAAMLVEREKHIGVPPHERSNSFTEKNLRRLCFGQLLGFETDKFTKNHLPLYSASV